ncbi:MAG TPA: hypothetical protein VMU54_05515 [Planctomycetota bacterium]|nr:hypothetical protein [Planctomycetota bacterium]
MISHCEGALETARAILGKSSSNKSFSIEDVEAAFLHLSRCVKCKNSLSSEDHVTFVSRVLLENE